MRRYEEPTPAEHIEAHARAVREAEEREAAKTLAQKKADYFAMCAGVGIAKKAAETAWQKYLKTGKT